MFLVFHDKRKRTHIINLPLITRITFDAKENAVFFYGIGGEVYGFDMDDVPLEAILRFVKQLVEIFVKEGDNDAHHDQNP
jgi:hypothetical protein